MTNTEWIRSRLLARVITTQIGDKVEPLAVLQETEWSRKFECLMRNRLLVGRFRYGRLHKKPGYDNVRSAIRRLGLYLQTGNTEHLVDAANLCLVEFTDGQHPNRHFLSQDDGEHVSRL